MLSVTKIFYFEMAHAIYGYSGPCKNVHGHSYELHVTVGADDQGDEFIPAPGFILDFKELKSIVNTSVIDILDQCHGSTAEPPCMESRTYRRKYTYLYSKDFMRKIAFCNKVGITDLI